jgi:lysyl-tRNA synthetase class 2
VVARLSIAQRTELWDSALAAIRASLRAQGLREVLTPVRLPAVALEPFIEPVHAGSGGLLATSPELPMKMLLAHGSGSVFQIAACHRKGERGRLHASSFHLVEWYRVGDDGSAVRRDVEAIVAAVFDLGGRAPPRAWEQHGLLDLVQATVGLSLRGDEPAEKLAAIVTARRPDLWTRPRGADEETRTLAAWTGFFSNWSDAALDPWLRARPAVHVVDFPIALAALADVGVPVRTQGRAGVLAHRCESYVLGIELANGYRELRDPVEQRRRFEIVARHREAYLQPALPMPEAFLAALEQPGLPACAGVALGLERLLMLAAGQDSVQDIALGERSSSPPRSST